MPLDHFQIFFFLFSLRVTGDVVAEKRITESSPFPLAIVGYAVER